jgi:hypothetical protein
MTRAALVESVIPALDHQRDRRSSDCPVCACRGWLI